MTNSGDTNKKVESNTRENKAVKQNMSKPVCSMKCCKDDSDKLL